MPRAADKHRGLRRFGWFLAIWLASVGALTVIAYGIRLMIL